VPAPQVLVEFDTPQRTERDARDLQRHGLVRRRSDVRRTGFAAERAARRAVVQRHLGARRIGQQPILPEEIAGF
jgi:hypothetical protein